MHSSLYHPVHAFLFQFGHALLCRHRCMHFLALSLSACKAHFIMLHHRFGHKVWFVQWLTSSHRGEVEALFSDVSSESGATQFSKTQRNLKVEEERKWSEDIRAQFLAAAECSHADICQTKEDDGFETTVSHSKQEHQRLQLSCEGCT